MSNGSSYQKFDGASGTYQEIPNGAGDSRSKKRKWLTGLVVLSAVGIVYGIFSIAQGKNPQNNVNKALAKDSNVQVKANGKLKLFDDNSK